MKKNSIGLIVLGLIVLALISYFGSKSYLLNKADKRQAVFLTNGQVYFGEVKDATGQIVELKNVYYLRKDQRVQNGAPVQGKVSLIKLGDEVHGPEDTMYINRDHILFYEDMRNNSKVNDAIKKYLEQGPASQDGASAPSETPTEPKTE